VNEAHLKHCASPEWAAYVRDDLLPWVLGSHSLGDDFLELGPGPGLTTDVLAAQVPTLTALEVDPALAEKLASRLAGSGVDVVEGDATAMPFDDNRFSGAACLTMLHHVQSAALQDRLFADVRRVLRPGGVFIGTDSCESPQIREGHVDDTYVPVDPVELPKRLRDAGFGEVEVEHDIEGLRFRFAAVKPG
jgi:SAM-dependent methyltransferase